MKVIMKSHVIAGATVNKNKSNQREVIIKQIIPKEKALLNTLTDRI